MTRGKTSARFWAIVPAAGRGERFFASPAVCVGIAQDPSASAPPHPRIAASRKQYATLAGASVIEWSLRPFLREPLFEKILVPLADDDDYWPLVYARIAREAANAAHRMISCAGGGTRQESVLNAMVALRAYAADQDWVLVHDAARPCLPAADLASLLQALRTGANGALLAAPLTDTLKRRLEDGGLSTLERNGLWRALTPQAFRFADLLRALRDAERAGVLLTDEAQAMERIGVGAQLIDASAQNIKITRADDLALAGRILASQRSMGMRIGQGFDVHAFTEGDHVVLGGVRIAHRRAILAHSDGDVLIHALCDAILGALGQGDIGRHFPDSEPGYRGADSRKFLREVAALMRGAGLRVVNADITVTAQAPRIAAHAPAMIANLSQDLGLEPDCLNIKATTTEKLGFIGREEGIAASAIVMLEPDIA